MFPTGERKPRNGIPSWRAGTCCTMGTNQPSTMSMVGRGVLAGIAGTAVMTAFQKFVEMPATGRGDSYAPADFAERLLPLRPKGHQGQKSLNYAAHFALGAMWGSAYGLAARTGLHGRRAVAVVFGTVYTGDVLLNMALGLYQPSTWSRQDWVIDIGEKLLQATATGVVFDHVLRPGSRS